MRGARGSDAGGSGDELFVQNPLFQILVGIEQQAHLDVPRLRDFDLYDVTRFPGVGRHADRALLAVKNVEFDGGLPG